MLTYFRISAAGLLAAAASLAIAQETRTPARLDPIDPASAVPAIAHRSSFEGYRPWRDEPVRSWRSANDTVGAIGGWKVYAREIEAAQSQKAATGGSSPASSGAPAAAPGGHKH